MAAAVSREKSSGEHAIYLRGGAPFAGKYAVERILGQGGMGTVFEARHIRLGHRVAIKVLGSELRDYPELVTRFEREARAAGALSSRHAVRVFDIDMTEDATPFIVMELLCGQDLARILEREGPQPVGRAVRWVIEACDAIAEAHRLGIVHRDIKPSNLFLADDGVKVLDFGIAKRVASKEASITHAVAPLGTPQYMSPEQVRCAKDVDARTDVWSVGVTLYELVTGRTPFAHESPSACIASIAADPVPDPRDFRKDLPEGLAAVLMRALRKDPAERYASIDELVAALEPFAVGEGAARFSSAMRRAVRIEESTLGDDDVDLFLVSHPPPLERPDGTVPPAISRAPVTNGARRRSSVALAGAALVGLLALVITPKCVGRADATATKHPAPTVTATTTAAPSAPPVLEVATATAAPTEAAVAEPTPEPAAAPASVVVAPAPPKKAARPAPSATTKARPESTTTIVRHFPSDSPVHGGLSSPGF